MNLPSPSSALATASRLCDERGQKLTELRRRVLEIIVHSRKPLGAYAILDVLRAEGAPPTVIFHCFSSGPEMAKTCVEAGWVLSLSGTVSFRNAHDLREAARLIPEGQLLVETDAPYLAPVPFRGKTNQPAYVRHVAEAVAAARGETLEAVAEVTTRNFFQLFKDARP